MEIRAVPEGYVPLGLREPGTTWGELPPRVLPWEWSTGQGDEVVPGALLAAEGERRPEGGFTPSG